MGNMKCFASREYIEKRVYIYLCIFAFMNVFSVAISNIFLGLTIAGTLHRIVRYHNDVREMLLQRKKILFIILLLWGTIILSLPNALDPIHGLKEFFNYYVYRMLVFPIIFLCVHQRKRLVNVAICMFIAMFLNDVYSIVQGISAYPSFRRCSGFMNIMPNASFLSIFIPASLVVFMATKGTRWYWGSGVFFITACLAFMFNGTRGAWLATLVITSLLMFFQIENKRKFFTGALVAVLVLGFAYQTVPSFQQRVQSIVNPQDRSNIERRLLWQSAWNMFADHPVTGVGMANFKQNYQERYILPEAKEHHLGHAHNNFMNVLAECGILGAGALLAFWGYIFVYGVLGWRKYRKAVYLLLLTPLLGMVLHGLTEYTWGTAITVKLFWLATALCLKWIDLDDDKDLAA